MIAATEPIQRAPGAKLLAVDVRGRITHGPQSRFVDLLRTGDLVIANDAATLPASLHGTHLPTGGDIEVRLAGRGSLSADDLQFTALVFGPGDFRTRTEDRALPPPFAPGDRVALGPLTAMVTSLLSPTTTDVVALRPLPGPATTEVVVLRAGSEVASVRDATPSSSAVSRLVSLRFDGSPDAVWAGLARHGRPIQYSHMQKSLALWDVWTPVAALPVAFEPPSAGFVLDWTSLRLMRERGIGFATITHAAGISSTGDPALDRRLPFDEPYCIPNATASAIRAARSRGGRIVAVGTTVVRALEHAGAADGVVRPGDGLANQRLGPSSRLRIADAILSGTHERGTSHYELLRAFADEATIRRVDGQLESELYRTHEFGDSVFVEAGRRQNSRVMAA